MNLLREYIRELIESTEHDDKFKELMDSGFEGIKQAMELADTLGIPSQDLPWDLESVDIWVWESGRGEHLERDLGPTGWTEAELWSHREGYHGVPRRGRKKSPYLSESTEHDDKFKELMDSGFDGIKQAMELADSLGIASQELPWDLESVDIWVWESGHHRHPERALGPTGWTEEEYRAAGQEEYEDYERKLGLREAIRALIEQSDDETHEKILQMFWATANQGIQIAEMTPGTEELAEHLNAIVDLVDAYLEQGQEIIGGPVIGRKRSLLEEPTHIEFNNRYIDIMKLLHANWQSDMNPNEILGDSTISGFRKFRSLMQGSYQYPSIVAHTAPPRTPQTTTREYRHWEALKEWARR